MKKELELAGLRRVILGYVLELIAFLFMGRAANGLMSSNVIPAIIIAVLSLVSMLLILWGVYEVREASFLFDKAKKPVVVRMVIAILAIIVLVLAKGRGSLTAGGVAQIGRQTILEISVILLVIMTVWILVTLATTRSLLRGCGHVAEQAEDPLFSMRCLRLWRFWGLGFLLLVLVVLAAIAVLLNVYRKTLENGAGSADLQETLTINMASGALLAGIIVLVGGLLFLIVHILYLLRLRKTIQEFHLEEVTVSDARADRPIEYEDLRQYALPEEEAPVESDAEVPIEVDVEEPVVEVEGEEE